MKVRLPIMIQDPFLTKRYELEENVEGFDPEEDYFLDGPVSAKIAVIDFSPETGELFEGAKFVRGKKRGKYRSKNIKDLRYPKGKEIYDPAFLQVSTFATILKTMKMFEEKETLGRSLTWANGDPQLLVIPRAGLKRNAFYHRNSNSLQFFMFQRENNPKELIYTCLYRDVVSHETGHAIIDGIAQDLFHAQNPDGLAIHEAIADLTALLMAISSHNLCDIVLKEREGELKDSSDFTTIAEKWRVELKHSRLRDLFNTKNFNPNDRDNYVGSIECHDRCEVLGGALYNVLIKIFEPEKRKMAKKPRYRDREKPLVSASGEALRNAGKRLKQMVFRACDLLPPGDVSFADFGRAIIAADTIAYPDDNEIRTFIRKEFKERYIVEDEAALEVKTFFDHPALKGISVSNLHKSDWAAYNFANQPEARSLLCIPPNISFEVLPRLNVTKLCENKKESHECIFKVGWDEQEKIGSLSKNRRFRVGTCLLLDWDTGKILALLTNAPQDETNTELRYPNPLQYHLIEREQKKQSESRDEFLNFLLEKELVKFGQHALDPDGHPLLSCIQGEDLDGKIRIRGTGKMLHIMSEEGS